MDEAGDFIADSAYREAVSACSPGLARFAATLGTSEEVKPTPTGLRQFFRFTTLEPESLPISKM